MDKQIADENSLQSCRTRVASNALNPDPCTLLLMEVVDSSLEGSPKVLIRCLPCALHLVRLGSQFQDSTTYSRIDFLGGIGKTLRSRSIFVGGISTVFRGGNELVRLLGRGVVVGGRSMPLLVCKKGNSKGQYEFYSPILGEAPPPSQIAEVHFFPDAPLFGRTVLYIVALLLLFYSLLGVVNAPRNIEEAFGKETWFITISIPFAFFIAIWIIHIAEKID
jgi:hypothetical protein